MLVPRLKETLTKCLWWKECHLVKLILLKIE